MSKRENPFFSLRLGDRAGIDVNLEGCIGLIVLTAVFGLCVVGSACSEVPELVAVLLGAR